jgi:hypothetical protein
MPGDTWTVVGGQGNNTIMRPCSSREEAEDWARKLIAAGFGPVKIDGVLFDPEQVARGKEAPAGS